MRNRTSSSSSRNSPSCITPAQGGAFIRVRLKPRSSRNMLEGVEEGSLRVRITAPPVEGEANRALIEFLSELTGIRKSAFHIESGLKSREKKVFVAGASAVELEKAVSSSLS